MLRTYEEALCGFDDKIVGDTAMRFTKGEIADQSLTFAPSVAEFADAVRELVRLRDAKLLSVPRVDDAPREPVEAKINKLKARYSGRAVLATGVDHRDFLTMVQNRGFPESCEYVALLGTVFSGDPSVSNPRP